MPRLLPCGWGVVCLLLLSIFTDWEYEPAAVGAFGDAQTYNEAVRNWKKTGKNFRAATFSICKNSTSCVEMQRNEDDMEGAPPKEGLMKYAAVHYDSTAQLLENERFVPSKRAELYIKGNRRLSKAPVAIPYFTWQFTDSTVADCSLGLGVWLKGICMYLFMLDRVCVTVSEAEDGTWEAQDVYGVGSGCSPTQYGDINPVDFPNYNIVGSWGAGIYTQVNASEVLCETTQVLSSPDRSLNNTNGLHPFHLPSTTWTADFTTVRVKLRSVADPRLTAENVTNGTLNFTPLRTPSAARSFFSTAIFNLSSTVTLVTIAILVLSIIFPGFRRRYILHDSRMGKRNKLQSQSRIYS
eukprot:TRINITY_DN27405_c0_g1_i1.p1 TRINITY_DN27405_c0_g1~~TRINITY_DN27405_c0_g1_i1.p1  ORF type:complete len:372 (+),score=58.16 TRINITY_DN27405_c0_g1_i1:58-1116(+)